jgi:hypothetical protein
MPAPEGHVESPPHVKVVPTGSSNPGPVTQDVSMTQDGAPPLSPRQYSVGPSSVQVAPQGVVATHGVVCAHPQVV